MPPEWPASLGDHLLRLANKQARHLLDWRNRITHTSTIQDLDAVLEMGPVPGLIDQELIDFLIAARPFVVATAEKVSSATVHCALYVALVAAADKILLPEHR